MTASHTEDDVTLFINSIKETYRKFEEKNG